VLSNVYDLRRRPYSGPKKKSVFSGTMMDVVGSNLKDYEAAVVSRVFCRRIGRMYSHLWSKRTT
jgi:hypothetical protein